MLSSPHGLPSRTLMTIELRHAALLQRHAQAGIQIRRKLTITARPGWQSRFTRNTRGVDLPHVRYQFCDTAGRTRSGHNVRAPSCTDGPIRLAAYCTRLQHHRQAWATMQQADRQRTKNFACGLELPLDRGPEVSL